MRKMALKHFLKRQNRSKYKIRKITVKSRNEVKSARFLHVLCHISVIFEDIDLKCCTHIHQTLASNIMYGFLKILILRGKMFEKKKLTFFENLFCWSKSAEQEVTLTSLMADLLWLGPNYLTQGVELLPGEVWQVSKQNFQYLRSYLRKPQGDPLGPPVGRGLKKGRHLFDT